MNTNQKGTRVNHTTRSGGGVGLGVRSRTPRRGFAPRNAAACAGLIVAMQTVLSGCGGAGSSTAASAGPGSAATTAAAKPPFVRHATATAHLVAERRAAGRAAAFVEAGADNSIPTFGSEAPPAERRAAEANLRSYLAARAARDWAAACRYLAASTRRGYEHLAAKQKRRRSCATLLPVLAPFQSGQPADPLRGHLLTLRAHGAQGFALFYGPPAHRQYMVPMRREAGQWRPTQASPIAYPPGT